MHNNRATKQNRNFMVLTTVLGLAVIGIVIVFWTIAFNNEAVVDDPNTTVVTDSLGELRITDETAK